MLGSGGGSSRHIYPISRFRQLQGSGGCNGLIITRDKKSRIKINPHYRSEGRRQGSGAVFCAKLEILCMKKYRGYPNKIGKFFGIKA